MMQRLKGDRDFGKNFSKADKYTIDLGAKILILSRESKVGQLEDQNCLTIYLSDLHQTFRKTYTFLSKSYRKVPNPYLIPIFDRGEELIHSMRGLQIYVGRCTSSLLTRSKSVLQLIT